MKTDLTRAAVATLCLATLAALAAPAASGATLDPFAAARLSEPTDLNFDGRVTSVDLGLLLGRYGGDPTGGADLNFDGVVDSADLGLLLGAWSQMPTVTATHVTGDASGWRFYVGSVVKVERSPFRSDWTRIWAIDMETGQLLGFDVDVYLSAAEGVLFNRAWSGPR